MRGRAEDVPNLGYKFLGGMEDLVLVGDSLVSFSVGGAGLVFFFVLWSPVASRRALPRFSPFLFLLISLWTKVVLLGFILEGVVTGCQVGGVRHGAKMDG